jgi:transposase InsO family protein
VRAHWDEAKAVDRSRASERTRYRWAALYQKAENVYGNGYLGLLPQTRKRGNRTDKLPEATKKLIAEFIAVDYERLKQKSVYASWIALKLSCQEQQLLAPSYETFRLAVHAKGGHDQTLKRVGPRAAYQQEPFYWELELTTPRHGDRPFEIGHVDHTELDIELVCSVTGRNLGRPWLSLLTDAFSRRVLAFYLSFDPPSYRACMMIIRECVRRHGRLPHAFVVDGGSEFGSIYFETLLARYECIKKTRPPAKARFGSVVERLFGTCNTQLIYNLQGNTQIMRNVRQVTKSVNPKQHAVWTLPNLNARLNEYLHDVYDALEHPALGQSPREAYHAGLAQAGQRQHRLVGYDHEFLILTLPTTSSGTAMVLPGRGVKIHHIYYWCDLFRSPEIERQKVPIRYDPFDAGMAFAFVKNQWVQCHSEYYALFRGRSEREIMLATHQLRRKRQMHQRCAALSAKKIGDFLRSIEAEELLLTQRLHDQQAQGLRPQSTEPPVSVIEDGEQQAVLQSVRPVLPHPEIAEEPEIYGAF